MLLIVYAYWQPTIMCENAKIVSKSTLIINIQVQTLALCNFKREAGRQGFVCQGSNNVHNSILTLSYTFFAF